VLDYVVSLVRFSFHLQRKPHGSACPIPQLADQCVADSGRLENAGTTVAPVLSARKCFGSLRFLPMADASFRNESSQEDRRCICSLSTWGTTLTAGAFTRDDFTMNCPAERSFAWDTGFPNSTCLTQTRFLAIVKPTTVGEHHDCSFRGRKSHSTFTRSPPTCEKVFQCVSPGFVTQHFEKDRILSQGICFVFLQSQAWTLSRSLMLGSRRPLHLRP